MTVATGTAAAAMVSAHRVPTGRMRAVAIGCAAVVALATALTTVPAGLLGPALVAVASWPWWSGLAASSLPPSSNVVLPQHLRGVPISGGAYVVGSAAARLCAGVGIGPAAVLGAGVGTSVSLGSPLPALVAGTAFAIRPVTAVAAVLPGRATRVVLAVGAGVVTAAAGVEPTVAIAVSGVAAALAAVVAVRRTDAVLGGVSDEETGPPTEVRWGRMPVTHAAVIELVRSRQWGEVFPPAVAAAGVVAAALTGTDLVSVLAVPAVLATTGLAHCLWTHPDTVGALVAAPDGLRRYLTARAAVAVTLAAPCALAAAITIGRTDGVPSGVVVIAVFLGCAVRAGWRAPTTWGPAARPILVDLIVTAVVSSVLLGPTASAPAATGWSIAATACVAVATATVALARRLRDGGAAWHAAVA
ncbi:hypothetical protein [Rhodococcoides corynebacterioides]|uniref:Uncharacterized protein n=1 Tax=Rhodococcoides corynebacterioides TaxID=53972 RepID=A0ABS7P6F2_9NOCA|nr:hypothetical protein [Rhodococcus corynebacterioides]MBY6367209.1 hypothetical protein [Rhodococcus corynebacterioides]MBY6407377.1 hypothetical protein [Rhodococcus corynebacterioides]